MKNKLDAKQFMKKKWQSFELIQYKSPIRDYSVECMVLQIDFVNELLLIEPIEKDIYEDKSFWVRVENCHVLKPKPIMKIVK